MSLAKMTAEDFEACQQQPFHIHIDEARSVDATLMEVKKLKGHASREGNTAFSVLFHSTKDIELPQNIYRLENKKVGEIGLFLVTVGPDPDIGGMCYEAVFN